MSEQFIQKAHFAKLGFSVVVARVYLPALPSEHSITHEITAETPQRHSADVSTLQFCFSRRTYAEIAYDRST